MRTRRGAMITVPALLWALTAGSAVMCAQQSGGRADTADVEAFDGSFRLGAGEVVTGGYMVENGASWVYMDTEGLTRGGLSADGLHGLDLDGAVDLRREVYRLAMRGAPDRLHRFARRPVPGKTMVPYGVRRRPGQRRLVATLVGVGTAEPRDGVRVGRCAI